MHIRRTQHETLEAKCKFSCISELEISSLSLYFGRDIFKNLKRTHNKAGIIVDLALFIFKAGFFTYNARTFAKNDMYLWSWIINRVANNDAFNIPYVKNISLRKRRDGKMQSPHFSRVPTSVKRRQISAYKWSINRNDRQMLFRVLVRRYYIFFFFHKRVIWRRSLISSVDFPLKSGGNSVLISDKQARITLYIHRRISPAFSLRAYYPPKKRVEQIRRSSVLLSRDE